MLLLDHTSVNSNFLYFSRLAHNSLKSVEVPPDPVKMSDFEGEQIFSEKVKDVANNLKVVWKKFGEHFLDLLHKMSFSLKKILHFRVCLEMGSKVIGDHVIHDICTHHCRPLNISPILQLL